MVEKDEFRPAPNPGRGLSSRLFSNEVVNTAALAPFFDGCSVSGNQLILDQDGILEYCVHYMNDFCFFLVLDPYGSAKLQKE